MGSKGITDYKIAKNDSCKAITAMYILLSGENLVEEEWVMKITAYLEILLGFKI